MPGVKSQQFPQGLLEFDPEPHVYRMGGIVIPSVTKIIYAGKPITAKDGRPIPGFVLAKAAAIGTTVHEWIEEQRKCNDSFLPDPPDPENPKALNGVKAYRKWIWDLNGQYKAVEWVWQERLLYNDESSQPYCGQADALLKLDGKQVVVDFKTSNELAEQYDWQLAAYHRAMEVEGILADEAWLVRLDKKTGQPEVKKLNLTHLQDGLSKFKERLDGYYKDKEEA